MASTLTAADISGIYQGYITGSGGSLSPDTFGGFLCSRLFTGQTAGSITLWLQGDATAYLAGKVITVDGTPYATISSAPAYNGFRTQIEWTYGPGNFVPGNSYSIDVGSGTPSAPNITSASSIINLVNTTLAHTITATKTIVSTAITGGADAAGFEINGADQLRFYSNAASNALGSLVVDIEITDTDGLTATQTITVPVKAIVFKGSKFYSRAGATSAVPVILTDFSNPLTGATGIAAAIGDTVVGFPAIGSNADRDMILNTGYAEQADHYINGTTYDANIGLFTKKLTSADTSCTIGSSGNANDAQAMILMLFQGVDGTTPMDVSVVLGQGTGTGKPNPEPITPITPGAVGIFGGAQAAATAVALTSGDLTAFTQRIQADTNDIAVGAGFIEWSGSGAIDPAVLGGGASNAANSWATISAALRPAWTGGGGSSGALTSAATGLGALTGQRTASSPATASATGSGSATGRATAQATASAAGTGTAGAVGRSIVSAALSASASGSGSIVGASVVVSAGAASGTAVGSTSLVGRSDASASVNASAAGAVSVIGESFSAANATAAGVGSAAVTGTGIRPTTATAGAAGSVAADGQSTAAGGLAASGAGSATILSAASSTVSGALSSSAAGSASVIALSSSASAVFASATGTGTVAGNAISPAILAAPASASGAVTGLATTASPFSSTGSGAAFIPSATNTTIVGALTSTASSSTSMVGRQVATAILSAAVAGQGAIVGTGVRTTALAALATSSGLAISAASVSAALVGTGVGLGQVSGALVNASALTGSGSGIGTIDGQRLVMATLNGISVSGGAFFGFGRLNLPPSVARTAQSIAGNRVANTKQLDRTAPTSQTLSSRMAKSGVRNRTAYHVVSKR